MPQVNALLIDRKTGQRLIALREHAKRHVIPFAQMQMRAHLHRHNPSGFRAIGDDQSIKVEVGYRVAYSIEEGAPGVPCHHLSVSGPNAMPHPDAMAVLMQLFGYPCSILECLVFTEEIDPVLRPPIGSPDGKPEMLERVAVNVVMPLSGRLDDLVNATPDEPDQSPVTILNETVH